MSESWEMTDRVDFAALTDRAMAQSGRGHMREVPNQLASLGLRAG